jgi:hypothetical protein
MRMKHYGLNHFALLLAVIINNASRVQAAEKTNTTSVYSNALIFLSRGNHSFYKYGNVKPINLEDAFCIFLTGDEDHLNDFKNLEFHRAIDYAMNNEHNLMRYDWGSESFMYFAKHMINHYGLWAPILQYRMAVQCFHIWMNYGNPDFDMISKRLRVANKELNKSWEMRYLEFTRYANNEHLKGRQNRKYQRFLRKSRACSL